MIIYVIPEYICFQKYISIDHLSQGEITEIQSNSILIIDLSDSGIYMFSKTKKSNWFFINFEKKSSRIGNHIHKIIKSTINIDIHSNFILLFLILRSLVLIQLIEI